MKGYGVTFRRLTLATLAGLLLSGVLLIPTMLYMRMEFDVPWRLPGDARLWTVAAHTTLSYLVLGISGALWVVHMRAGWRMRRNHYSGSAMVACMALLALTGAGILYLGNERLALGASGVHTVLGLLATLLFLYHFLIGRHRFVRGPVPRSES